MGKIQKIILKIQSGETDSSLSFDDLLLALRSLDLRERTGKGSHQHVFQGTGKGGQPIFLNLQSDNGKAKPYQVRQVRRTLTDLEVKTDKELETP